MIGKLLIIMAVVAFAGKCLSLAWLTRVVVNIVNMATLVQKFITVATVAWSQNSSKGDSVPSSVNNPITAHEFLVTSVNLSFPDYVPL